MFDFRARKAPLIGVDLSSSAVKLLELSRPKGPAETGFRVESYAVEPLPPGAVVEKKIADLEAVGETLNGAVKRSATKARRAAIAVSGSSVITKVISLPVSLSEREMEEQINLEADQYIPYALDDVNLDFTVLGPSAKGADLVDVLLAASRRENVSDRLAALELAGLTAAVVDVEGYAISNACETFIATIPAANRREQAIAVADIGANAIAVHVLDEGRVIYSREQAFGGNQLTEEIAHRYELTPSQAGAAKRKGGLPPNYQTEVLGPFLDALAQQINRALQFFYSASAQKQIGLMIIAGGNANLPNIDGVIGARINTKTLIAQPFTGMSFSPRVDSKALLADGPAMLVAVGLALRGFD